MTFTDERTFPSLPAGLGSLAERVREVLTVEKVVGEPIERNGATIVPVVALRGLGGGGGGADEAERESGGGLGFGVSARPVGAYVLRDGEVTWEPAVDATKVAVTIIAVTFMVTRLLRRRR